MEANDTKHLIWSKQVEIGALESKRMYFKNLNFMPLRYLTGDNALISIFLFR